MSIKKKCLEVIKKNLDTGYKSIYLNDDVHKPETDKKPTKIIRKSDSRRFQLFYKYNAVKVTEYDDWYDVEFANGKWCYVWK